MRKDKKSKRLKNGKAVNVVYLTIPFRLKSSLPMRRQRERETEYSYYGELSTLAGIKVVNELT
jgi:hypothetical protein